MKPIIQILTKSIALGPFPYLILAAAILGVGVVLQIQSGTTANLSNGGSVFGLMAQIGGAVGLFGLLTMAFGGLVSGPVAAQNAPQPLPVSAFDARLTARPARVRPTARPADANATTAKPSLDIAPAKSDSSALTSSLSVGLSAAKSSLQKARTLTQALKR